MSETPLVTIICLCYNHEEFVIEALNSITSQTYKNIEMIIVDDKSSDNSAELIKNWIKNNSAAFIQNKNNIGNTKAFNKALKLAKGDYIVDFATDDVLLTNSIEAKIKIFKSSSFKNLGVVFSNVEYIDETGKHKKYFYDINQTGKSKIKPLKGDIYKEIVYTFFICATSMLIKKEVFNKLKGYDENLSYEDLDFWFRSSRLYEYDYSDEVLVKKRVSENSLSSNFYNRKGIDLARSTYTVCKKAYYLNKSKPEHKALENRLVYEIRLALKNRNFIIAFKFLWLLLLVKYKTIL